MTTTDEPPPAAAPTAGSDGRHPPAIPAWFDSAAGLSWRFLVVAATIGVILSGLATFSVIVVPIVLALFLAAALDPLFRFLRRHQWPPALASISCVLVMLVGLGLVGWLVATSLVEPWSTISPRLTAGLDRLQAQLRDVTGADTSQAADTARGEAGSSISLLLHGAVRVASVAVSVISTIMLSLFVLFFYLKDGPTMWAWVSGLGGSREPLVDRVGRAMWERTNGFVRGTALVALADATGIALGAAVLGVPSVGAIFVLTVVMAFVPYFGATIAGFLAVLLAISVGGIGRGLAMLAIILVVQLLEGNLLQPLLVGKAVSLHPMVVALGVIAGGAVAGILGMFVSVPLIAAASAGLQEIRATAAAEATEAPG